MYQHILTGQFRAPESLIIEHSLHSFAVKQKATLEEFKAEKLSAWREN